MPSITTTDDTLITSTHDGDLQCAIDDTRDFDNAIVAHYFLFGTESFMTRSYICGYHHPKSTFQ